MTERLEGMRSSGAERYGDKSSRLIVIAIANDVLFGKQEPTWACR
jgi:hypothetical protein